MSKTSLLACLLVAMPLPAATPPAAIHLGVATCATTTCHGSVKPTDKGIIQQNEYVTWSRFDPHAAAYRTLFDERSVTIARRLGIGPPHEAKICLDCHTDNALLAQRGTKFQLDDGIGCEVCHGGAAAWLATHDDDPAVGHADNIAKGMTALDMPGVRAQICVGCHVGGADTNGADRFASHRLMAAGHPRLSFELDTYTELWRTSGGREHYRVDADYAQRKPPSPAAEVWAAGLVANSHALIGQVSSRYGTDGSLPDFALFNCYSCHRTMRLRDWQDKGRDANAEPGSLRFDDSVLAVLQAALTARPDLQSQLREDRAAFQKTAGAAGGAVTMAAASLDGTLAAIGRALATRPLTAKDAALALDALARGAGRGDYPDYVSAEQAAMGIAVLVSTTGSAGVSRGAIDDLFNALENDERYDPQHFRRALEQLK